MIPIRNGLWSIERVAVNSAGVASDEGFRHLVVSDNQVRIEPAGIDLTVNQSTARSAVMESRSQIFFAEFFEQDEKLRLVLSRPSFAETVSFDASFAFSA